MYELSLIELESELSAELPTRSLMSRRHGRHSVSANNGSVANGNSTNQSIRNSQTAALLGVNSGRAGLQANGALVLQLGLNHNDNTNTQFGTPTNINA